MSVLSCAGNFDLDGQYYCRPSDAIMYIQFQDNGVSISLGLLYFFFIARETKTKH